MRPRALHLGLAVLVLVAGACRSAPGRSNEWKAFVTGRMYAEAWALSELKDYEKSAAQWVKAQALASELGIADPPSQSEYLKQEGRMASELKVKHGEKVQAHFLVASRLMLAWVGVKTGAGATKDIQGIGEQLAASGIPTDVWKPLMTKIAAGPTAEDLRQLTETLQRHLESGMSATAR